MSTSVPGKESATDSVPHVSATVTVHSSLRTAISPLSNKKTPSCLPEAARMA